MDAETQEIRQARQRASVKWLLSKAFNNRVPENLKEPFYRDNENHERLKPQIIVELGNATLYCQTLSNLYSDPNYQSLNHWSILQTLARKGVPVNESPDMPLTETVLIQTNPLRIHAHMLVIESLMLLYAKEISAGERITNAVRRVSGIGGYQAPNGQPVEQQILAWISHTCAALKKRIISDVETGLTDDNGMRLQTPDIPPVRDFQDLCDGICLALLISYYCPKALPWTSVRINYLPAVEDSIHNLLLVSNFSQKHLPYSVFHMTPEDITYMRGSMRLNLVVLLTDLFNLFEIHPAKCVSYAGMDSPDVIAKRAFGANEHGICHRRGLTQQPVTPIPDLRSDLDSIPSGSPVNRPPFQGEYNVAAGRPSNWEQHRRPSYAGRRSRRNSSSEDSQLTIENFGGSQDQLNMIGRYERDRDRLGERDRERKLSNTSVEPAVAVRSSIADARGTLQLGYDTDSGSEKQDREQEKYYMRRQASVDNVSIAASNAHLNTQSNDVTVPTTSTAYREHSADKDFNDSLSDSKVSAAYEHEVKLVRKSSTASMPVNSSWQHEHDPYDDDVRSLENASRLSTIRMKLEEKRRRIEQDKRRIEMALMRQETDDFASEMGKWETLSNESKRTPDMDPLEMDKYQQSIAIMNMNLQDIQHDIQRLATQQNQIQAQHLQAQQLLHAQQIANMLNQQTYGSQQHLAEPYHQRSMQQQNFGSSPHIPQAFHQQQPPPPSVNAYNSRPPSRDPYHQMPPQQTQPMASHMQFVNEHGQYMSPQQQQPNSAHPTPPHYMQPQSLYNDNASPYNNHSYAPQYAAPPPQQQQPPYLNNRPAPMAYDDYGHLQQQQQQHGRDPNSPQPMVNHSYYLHDTPPQQAPPPTQRRTWAQPSPRDTPQQQHHQQSLVDVNAWQSQKKQPSWTQPQHMQQQQHQSPASTQGFVLHQNGGGGEFQHLFQVHSSPQHHQQQHHQQQQQHNNVQRTNSTSGMVGGNAGGSGGVQRQHSMTNLRDNRTTMMMTMPKTNAASGQHQQQQQQHQQQGLQPPADDMMAPQSICFIGDDEDVDELERNIIESMQNHARISDYSNGGGGGNHNHHMQHQQMNNNNNMNARGSSSEDYDSNELVSQKLHITSGNLTYRIPSPARPQLHANSFQDPREEKTPEKGFYISFDDEQPKRPKPPLRRAKGSSPKKERSLDSVDHQQQQRKSLSQLHNNSLTHDVLSMETTSNNKSTYNKYTDAAPVNLKQLGNNENLLNGQMDQRDQQNQSPMSPTKPQSPTHNATLLRQQQSSAEAKSKALVIGADVTSLDPESVDEMERRKEKILMLSMQRRQQQEEAKVRKELEAQQKRELERQKEEDRARKKEEQMARRAAILEQHRLKKAIEEAEREGKTLDRTELTMKQQASQSAATPRLRQQRNARPRPKTIHVDDASVDISEASSISSRGKKGSSTNLTESPDDYPSTSSTPIGRRGSYKTSRDSGLGRATPPRRAPSPGMATTSGRHLPSPSGPGSLPPGLISKRRGFDDGSSDNSMMEYSALPFSGPKLYKQPAAKSNRGIILNAVEYCVFPGAVNREHKQKVLEKIARSEAKHFLVLFRDAGCQFRALYSYVPETEQVSKLYGTGPSQVDDVMFDKFFKYNSGGKCFSQVHTKHLTVTIDAFTIHNSLWQGKKVHLPSKKDMALVI